jgi:hypothetical protein
MKTFRLENEPKIKSGFNTPDNYFDDFTAKIMQQLPEKEPKVLSLFQKKKFLLMLVAAVLVIALFIPVLNTFTDKSKELDSTALENYLTDQSNMSQYDFINELDSADINKMPPTVALEDETIEDILSYNSKAEHLIME